MSYQGEYRSGGPYGDRRRYEGGSFRRRDYGGDDRTYARRRRRSRSRSRSPPRNRDGFVRRRLDISTSRERSRNRERRRRKQQAECIRRAGGFKKLADSEGREPVRLFWDGFQWVAKTGASSALLSDPILVNSTRKLRRLYFGNLPLHLGLTETNFQQIVYQEMKKRGFCNDPNENPVLCVWFAKDKGNYGFVEFASVEETERALTMDGMDCLGVAIKVSRPNDYCSATQQQNPAMTLMGQQSAQMLQMQAGVPVSQLPGGALAAALGVAPELSDLSTSKVLCLKKIVLPTDVEDAEEYNEILEDIREGCEQCGKTVNSLIVTPKLEGKDILLDVGDVYLEFETARNADTCLSVMSERKYFERPIQAIKVSNETFTNRIVPAAMAAMETLAASEQRTGGESTNGAEDAAMQVKLDEV
eukprot:Gregarina_sp_Pseudo_9__767@NODE_1492_length_1552_cov_11_943159_g1382_i0_p1_GENE_NODE_1492_length_1552_cov_11_943159_g1382_i0NODE_1492_length_1552_cov_11_943159_g1382_i0_p1_ORF_typecomplete_len417_score66_20RRM_1/PF00076_22/0_00032RRM_1/PF00076_22/0_13Limkainb1/PF11608_8/0_02Limkainb1/PF11608_8/29HisKA/PF00512_25/0_27_NODE_1492_length_1552_cov_11_943159_g1382_i01851435